MSNGWPFSCEAVGANRNGGWSVRTVRADPFVGRSRRDPKVATLPRRQLEDLLFGALAVVAPANFILADYSDVLSGRQSSTVSISRKDRTRH